MDETPPELTEIFRKIRAGDVSARENLFSIVYEELRRMAHGRMVDERRRGRRYETLQTTALAHEAYLRLCKDKHEEWENRRHFFGAAVRAMRQILVDRARERAAVKRGGDQRRVTLDDHLGAAEASVDVMAVHESLERLSREYPDHAKVVEYRFFLGLTNAEVAGLLDVSEKTVNNRWRFARAWMQRDLGVPDGDSTDEPGPA